jgi:hypothetical protein
VVAEASERPPYRGLVSFGRSNSSRRVTSVNNNNSIAWEWLAVDDGSADDSVARVREAMRGMTRARDISVSLDETIRQIVEARRARL